MTIVINEIIKYISDSDKLINSSKKYSQLKQYFYPYYLNNMSHLEIYQNNLQINYVVKFYQDYHKLQNEYIENFNPDIDMKKLLIENEKIPIIKSMQIILNGNKIIPTSNSIYDSYLTQYCHDVTNLVRYINMYSWSLKPFEKYINGTINLSNVENVEIELDVDGDISNTNTANIMIIAENVNVLRFLSGYCGLLF